MDLKNRIHAFAALGKRLDEIASEYSRHEENAQNTSENISILKKAEAGNGWFTKENIVFALKSWANVLNEENLRKWTSVYDLSSVSQKTVAVVMAGNIPLVGFHDFLSVLISGNKVKAKLSSNDQILIPYVANILVEINSEFRVLIQFVTGKLENFDAVIATGSNNTARYFDYYFGKYPHIIRHNRNSVAVLSGNESLEDLEMLSDDIFRYFGLGCRNVSKLFVPVNYDFQLFFQACYKWKEIIYNNKYINNYDYNKAVYLMDSLPLLDNEFLILKEDTGFSSPIGVLFYEFYENRDSLNAYLDSHSDKIQAVVCSNSENCIPFGKAQEPELTDYADGVDVLQFLIDISS